jgi:hypothetical protein
MIYNYIFLTETLGWKSQADSKTGDKVEKQAKFDQAMCPQRWLIF